MTVQTLDWAAIVGALAPLLIAVLVQTPWSSQVKSWAAFGVCLAAAAVTAYVRGTINWQDIGVTTVAIVTAAQATYHGLWKPSNIAPSIERWTNVVKAVATSLPPNPPAAPPTAPPAAPAS